MSEVRAPRIFKVAPKLKDETADQEKTLKVAGRSLGSTSRYHLVDDSEKKFRKRLRMIKRKNKKRRANT